MDSKFKDGFNVVVVGGGAIGASASLMLFEKLEKLDLPFESIITLIDPKDYPGAGVTYWDNENEKNSEIYWNNQPNERMLICKNERDAFSQYLAEHSGIKDYKSLRTNFSSRASFGAFVNERIQKAIQNDRNSSVKLQYRQSTVSTIVPSIDGTLKIVEDNGSYLNAHSVIVSTGHQKNGIFQSFRDQRGFFESPANISELHAHIANAQSGIAIIGGGQSMIDALAAIKHGANGHLFADSEIHLLNNSVPAHWAFHPEQHPVELDDVPFTPSVLTRKNIIKENAYTLEKLKNLLQQEVKFAQKHPVPIERGRIASFGPGHIYAKLNVDDFADLFDDAEKASVLNDFKNHVSTLFSSPTPPERYQMLQDSFKSGMKLHLGYIAPESIRNRGDKFTIQISGEDPLHVGTIINATCFARQAHTDSGVVYNPLLRTLHESRYLKKSSHEPGYFEAGEQNLKGLHLASGPATHRVWGMEKFSDLNKNIVESIVHNAL